MSAGTKCAATLFLAAAAVNLIACLFRDGVSDRVTLAILAGTQVYAALATWALGDRKRRAEWSA